MTSLMTGPRRSSKTLPKAKFAPNKGHVHCLVVCCWSTAPFRAPMKPLHLRSMLSKSMRCTKSCNACSRHWSTERAQFSATMPNSMLHNQHFKNWTNWATKFCLILHIHLTSHQLTTTSQASWQVFEGKCFHNQLEAENVFQEFIKSQSMDFYASGINKLLGGKSVLIVMVPYFD